MIGRMSLFQRSFNSAVFSRNWRLLATISCYVSATSRVAVNDAVTLGRCTTPYSPILVLWDVMFNTVR